MNDEERRRKIYRLGAAYWMGNPKEDLMNNDFWEKAQVCGDESILPRKIVDYKLLAETSSEALTKEVMTGLTYELQPYGAPFADETWIYQAMVRYL